VAASGSSSDTINSLVLSGRDATVVSGGFIAFDQEDVQDGRRMDSY
jgi:hypothetical protein